MVKTIGKEKTSQIISVENELIQDYLADLFSLPDSWYSDGY